MPTTIATDVVEYHFRCFCGTPIRTSEKTVNCGSCGRALGIRRVTKRRHWTKGPYRALRPEDVWFLGIRVILYVFLACYVYDLGQYVCDLLNG